MCIYNACVGLDGYGWTKKYGELYGKIKKTNKEHILKGCRCKTGCTSNRCKCGRMCGPGCQCINCVNSHFGGEEGCYEEVSQLQVERQEDAEESEEYTYETDDEIEDEETTRIMEMVFGEDEEDDYITDRLYMHVSVHQAL